MPGDILVFDGEGANPGSGRWCQSMPIYWAQKLFFKSAYSPSYMHVAVCSAKSDLSVEICHLTDTNACSGSLKFNTRNVSERPFARPFIIIRPPEDWSSQIVEELKNAMQQPISTSNFAYIKTLFTQPKSDPVKCTGYKQQNTCVGFVVNVMHLVAQHLGKPYPVSIETTTVELLNHTRQLSQPDQKWTTLLVPGYKKTVTEQGKVIFSPTDLIETIKLWAKGYQTTTSKKWFGGADKSTSIESILNEFNSDPTKNQIENGKQLLSLLKPVMEQARILGRSTAFEHLLASLESKGIYKKYLGFFEEDKAKKQPPTFTETKYW